jgi:hypothetical protein
MESTLYLLIRHTPSYITSDVLTVVNIKTILPRCNARVWSPLLPSQQGMVTAGTFKVSVTTTAQKTEGQMLFLCYTSGSDKKCHLPLAKH